MTVYRTGWHNHRTIYVQTWDGPDLTDVQVGTMDTPELGVLVVELLNAHDRGVIETDRNARAYGWEIGRRGLDPVAQVETSKDNPFLDPDWRSVVIPPSHQSPSGWITTEDRVR